MAGFGLVQIWPDDSSSEGSAYEVEYVERPIFERAIRLQLKL
jgi:hypothetical protein